MAISNSLQKNLKFFKDKLKSSDISFFNFKLANVNACLIFAKELVDKQGLGLLVVKPLTELKEIPTKDQLIDHCFCPEKNVITDANQAVDQIAQGTSILIVDGIDLFYAFSIKNFEKRAISEPPTSTVIKGPREGFVESLPVNVSLLRRKIKSPDLIFENMNVGKYSKTPIAICYIDGIADKELVKTIKRKIQKIQIDAILDSSYITKYLGEHKSSLFKQIGNTEKPDILSAKLLEGRVAILVDGSPIALTIPYLLLEDFQSPSDYYASSYTATIARILRLISVLISLLLPALFVSAELFHIQFIPLSFLLTIENSIKGIPLSPSYEMFFTLLIFEILNEASVRMPKYVGMVVSIVGALVLGETAVNAGIISAPTLMIIALSGICLYTVPELQPTFSVVRLMFLIIAGSLGVYGMFNAGIILIFYLTTFENYGTPLCAPFSPLVTKDLKDSFYKGFLIEQKVRPISLKNKNKQRMEINND